MKKKDKFRRKRLIDEIFGFRWYFQIGGTEDSAFKWYCGLFGIPCPPDEAMDNHAGCFGNHHSVQYTGLIWIRKDGQASTVAHEVAHAVAHVCRVLDLDPRQADEFQASYTGYLYGKINTLLKK